MTSVAETLNMTVKINVEIEQLDTLVKCIEELDRAFKGAVASIHAAEPTFDQKAEFLESKIAYLEAQLDSLYEEEHCQCEECNPPFYVNEDGLIFINGTLLKEAQLNG